MTASQKKWNFEFKPAVPFLKITLGRILPMAKEWGESKPFQNGLSDLLSQACTSIYKIT